MGYLPEKWKISDFLGIKSEINQFWSSLWIPDANIRFEKAQFLEISVKWSFEKFCESINGCMRSKHSNANR